MDCDAAATEDIAAMPAAIGPARFFQLGYVTRDIHAALPRLEQLLGAARVDLIEDFRDGQGNPTPLQNLSHLALPGAEIELIQPREGHPSIYLDALPGDPAEVGLHHLGFLVPDKSAWDEAVERLNPAVNPIAMSADTPAVRFAYFDTRARTGHYTELVLRYPSVI